MIARTLLGSTALALILVAGPALADCQPAVPANGQTVTCTGLDTVGVDGSAATQVTVNVLAGATVNPAAATTAIAVGSLGIVTNADAIVNLNVLSGFDTVGIDLSPGTGSVATNLGSIAVTMDAGDMAAVGIRTGNGNAVVNSGTIQATATNSFSSAAIAIGGGAGGGDGNVVTNTGALLANGSQVDLVAGIVLNDANVITNGGRIIASSNDASGAFAISVVDGNTITNNGTLAGLGVGLDEGRGIIADSSNVIVNNGAIVATSGDCCGIGIEVFDGNTITNNGTVIGIATATGQGIGISVGSSSTVVNNGTVVGATVDGIAIGIFGQVAIGTTIVNNGTIGATAIGAGQALGIAALFQNTIVNNGTIEVSAPGGSSGVSLFGLGVVTNTASGRIVANSPGGIGIEFDGTDNTLINQGLIQAIGAGGFALSNCGCASNTTVVNSGTIDGAISLAGGGNTVANSGLITVSMAGSGIDHVVAGAFTQAAGGTLALRVDAAGGFDALAADAVALGGTLRATVQPGLYANTQTYVGVVTGTTIAGTFGSVVSSSPFFAASAAYFPSNVDLTLTRIPFGAVPGSTDNQRAVGGALEAFYSTALTGNAATIYANVLAAASLGVLDQLSGEVGTGVQNPSFAMGDAFFGALGGQTQRWRAGHSGGVNVNQASGTMRVQLAAAQPMFGVAQATPTGTTWPPRRVGPRWSAWASGFGLSGARDGDGGVGSARLSYSMGGGAFGADAEIAPNLLLGGAVAAAAADFSLDGRASSGEARTIFFGLYGSWTMGALYVDAALSYGHGQFSTSRAIVLGSTAEQATGSFEGNQYGGRLEAGWRFMVQRTELTPFAALAVQALQQNGYNETTTNGATGAPGFLGLSYAGETTTSVRSFLGGQATTTFQLGERTRLTPRLRLAWAHEYSADRQVGASFLSIPGAAFTVNGARPARDAAIVGAGVDVALGSTVALFAQFDGDLSGSGNAYAGSGGIRITW